MSATVVSSEVAVRRHRLTVNDFHKMGDAGLFAESERVELIEGELLDMSPIGSDHAGAVLRLNQMLNRAVSAKALVSIQSPVTLDEYSQPEPDIALLRPKPDFYSQAHPRVGDVLLLIEVADTSIAYDRSIKVPLYARHAIPEVWLLDLPKKCVEIYRHPSPESYRMILRPGQDEAISPLLLPTITLTAGELFLK